MVDILIKILVCFIAGAGAGIGTARETKSEGNERDRRGKRDQKFPV